MFMYPNFSASFLNVFEDLHTPLSTVLQYPQLVAGSRLDMGNINRYLSYHIQEILNIVLSDKPDPSASLLVNILSYQIKDIFNAILTKSNFSDMATEILSNPNSSEQIIARLSIITLSALLTVPNEATKQCGFIYYLLKRCDNNSAYNLFATILAEDERCYFARKWLRELGFFDYILRELDSIDFENYKGEEKKGDEAVYDHVYFIATALYTLISRCSKTETFKEDILNLKTIIILKKTFKNDPPVFLKNARWKAISSIVCQQNANDMSSLLPEACAIISFYIPHVFEYRSYAISFISSIICFSPTFASFAVDEKVPNYLLSLLLQFQNCSILHSTIIEFVAKTIEIEPIGVNITQIFVPIIIDEAKFQKSKVFLPVLYSLADIIHKASKKNKPISNSLSSFPEFEIFCRKQLADYHSRIKKSYGGKFKNPITDFFNNIVFE